MTLHSKVSTQEAQSASFLEMGDNARPATSRPTIYGLQYVISTGHWLTTQAGVRMLDAGGNAYDAVAAAAFAAAIVEPTSSFSIGAECVYMFRDKKKGRTLSLCGQGGASRRATPQFFRDQGLRVIPTGPGEKAPLSFTTPGMVGATLRLLSDFGTKSLQEVLAPSIRYARGGIVSYDYMTSRLGPDSLGQLTRFRTKGAALFFPDGEPARPGHVLRQPEYADVLQALADSASGATRVEGIDRARRTFYEGAIAEKIAAASLRVGGILDADDLANFHESYEEPASIDFRGYKIECQQFWSQAPVALQALNILERFDLRGMGHNSAAYVHVVSEALKLAFADREAHYGDPLFTEVPTENLLSKSYGKARSDQISKDKTYAGLPPSGLPVASAHSGENVWELSEEMPAGPETGTTHISVVDPYGNVVACTPSGGAFGKSVYLDELGFTLSTRSEMLNLSEGHPNCVAPGKRPRTTLVNYIATGPSGEIVTFGCPGGETQAQANLQLMLNTIVWGMNPQHAVEAPRFATMSVPNSFFPHQFQRGKLNLEQGFSEEAISALKAMGHELAAAASCGMGATVTRLDQASGVKATSSDPRRSCHAIGC